MRKGMNFRINTFYNVDMLLVIETERGLHLSLDVLCELQVPGVGCQYFRSRGQSG